MNSIFLDLSETQVPPILTYLSRENLKVVEKIVPDLVKSEDLWRSRIELKIKYGIPRGATPQYRSFRDQLEVIENFSKHKGTFFKSSFPKGTFLAPLFVDLGEKTLSFQRDLFETRKIQYDHYFTKDKYLYDFYVLVLAWGHPLTFDYLIERDSQFKFHIRNIYSSHNFREGSLLQSEFDRKIDIPSIQGLKKLEEYTQTGKDFYETVEDLQYLNWGPKEAHVIDYILTRIPKKKRDGLREEFILEMKDQDLLDYFLMKYPTRERILVLEKYLDRSAQLWDNLSNFESVFIRYRSLIKPHRLGIEGEYHSQILDYLREINEEEVLDFRAQIMKQTDKEVVGYLLKRLVDLEYDGDVSQYIKETFSYLLDEWRHNRYFTTLRSISWIFYEIYPYISEKKREEIFKIERDDFPRTDQKDYRKILEKLARRIKENYEVGPQHRQMINQYL